MTEDTTLIEIDGGRPIWVVIFSANGEHLISGDDKAVRVWRVADGEELGTMVACDVRSIAVSKNGEQIAAGTELGRFTVWNARTYETIFTHKESNSIVRAVDFSPNSTRLVSGLGNCTASVWDWGARERVLGPLHHQHGVVAAKYSPQGDHIATCTDPGSIRVYDDLSGQLLLDIATDVIAYCNLGLAWSNDGHFLFFVSNGKIKQLQVLTKSVIGEWQIPDYRSHACIAPLEHRGFIAYSSNRTVHFLDTSTGIHPHQAIKYDQDVHSMTLSPDSRVLATSTGDRKITIRSLQNILNLSSLNVGHFMLLDHGISEIRLSTTNFSHVINLLVHPLSHLHCIFKGPFIYIGGSVLNYWKQNRFAETEALLTEDTGSANPSHRTLAYRALVRTRLQKWNAANDDAEKSIAIQPSVIGLIAKCVALVSEEKKQEAYRACDLAFKYCHSDRIDILLAIKAVIVCMAGEYTDAISRVSDLIATTHDTFYYVVQAYIHLLHGNSRFEHGDHEGAIESFECAQSRFRRHSSRRLWTVSLISGWNFDDVDTSIQQNLCDALYAAGRVKQAGDALLKMINNAHTTNPVEPITQWTCGFIQRCLSSPDIIDDPEDTLATEHECSATTHTCLPSKSTSISMLLLAEWAKMKLTSISWKDVLAAAVGFTVPRVIVYRAACECLEVADRLTDAIDCFHQMVDEQTIAQDEEPKWVLNFRHRCSKRLEDLGDVATNARKYDAAISHYSAALILNPATPQDILVKRSKAYAEMGLSKDALNDANEIIRLDPSSPLGYERKHAALQGEGHYENAIDAFKRMLSRMLQSSDPETRERYRQYVEPEETEATIRQAVRDVVRDLPRVLINTTTGRLLNKREQESMFESSPLFMELVSSMTTYIDTARIEHKVAEYYRYATFSHTWEENEPLFEQVIHIVVYDLEATPTHNKLQMFCEIVRDAGFNWAWSDNCCINKQDHLVLHEALLAMFKWYQGSSLMVVFLRGVRSPSRRGDLVRSIWNTRAWTFQEYHAAKAIRFYTEDWTPYLNFDIPNHKESPEIISEMEEATGISALALRALRPGLNDIREKLSLASRREATYIEDKAYSLFGIFDVTLPIAYGEGERALGRLLAHLLASSGDTSILAWTGKSNSFNSCLPTSIAVFHQLPTSHIPPTKETRMETVTAKLHASLPNLTSATMLYDQLSNLPVPSLSAKRIRLPCIVFKLGHPKHMSNHTFRAKADAFGIVEVVTTEDLSRFDSLYLVHPWIDFLLDRQPVGGWEVPATGDTEIGTLLHDPSSLPGPSNFAFVSQRTPTVISRLKQSLGPRRPKPVYDSQSLLSPSRASLTDKRTQVLQFVARLRQPFGALLFTPTRLHVAEYKRVSTDSLITVQIQKDASLGDLIPNVQMLDVL